MNEQEKTEKIGMFKSAAEGLVKLFEMHADGLWQMEEMLGHRAALAEARTKELDKRELDISRREAEVRQIRQIAADRKAQLEAAQDVAAKANEARKKAEADLRLANGEKASLGAALAVLLKEKNELAAQPNSPA
jgi:uncharacterized protein (DUF3084 family)